MPFFKNLVIVIVGTQHAVSLPANGAACPMQLLNALFLQRAPQPFDSAGFFQRLGNIAHRVASAQQPQHWLADPQRLRAQRPQRPQRVERHRERAFQAARFHLANPVLLHVGKYNTAHECTKLRCAIQDRRASRFGCIMWRVFVGEKGRALTYQYPLNLRFKLVALAPQIYVTDATSQEILFVRQKVLKLKEDVRIFSDSSKSQEVFRINADRVIDFSANYHFTDSQTETPLGSVKHKGMRSIWNATYLVFDASGQQTHKITEDNPWVKVLDAAADAIPVVSWFTGYIFHPSYTVYRADDDQGVMQITKQPAFFESSFKIVKLEEGISPEEEKRLLLSLLMMVQLERSRG